jgi:hypothetical protein
LEIARNYEHHWALDVATALDAPLDRVTVFTGYRDDRATYNSDIIQVRGVATEKLLEAVVSTFASTMPGRPSSRSRSPSARSHVS